MIIKDFHKAYYEGVNSVFEFLEEMEKIEDVKSLKEEHLLWENADKVHLPNGNILNKCNGEIEKLEAKKTKWNYQPGVY